jgi:hypothetical protein
MDPNGFSITKMMRKGSLCNDCTVLAGKMTVVFENGTRADIGGGVYLHHSVAIDISKKIGGFVSACPPGANAAINELLKQGGAGGVNTFIGGAVVSRFLNKSCAATRSNRTRMNLPNSIPLLMASLIAAITSRTTILLCKQKSSTIEAPSSQSTFRLISSIFPERLAVMLNKEFCRLLVCYFRFL